MKAIGIADHWNPQYHGVKDVFNEYKAEIERVKNLYAGRIKVMCGVEVDVSKDGEIDDLPEMDFWIAALHSVPGQDIATRMISAAKRGATIIAHPSGRSFGARPMGDTDWEAVFRQLASLGVMLELNGSHERLDLCEALVPLARECGCYFTFASDCHSMDLGKNHEAALYMARRARLKKFHLVNPYPVDGR